MFRCFSLRQMGYGMGLFLAMAIMVIFGCSNLSNPIAPQTAQLQPSTISHDAFVVASIDPATGREVMTRPRLASTTRIIAAKGGQVSLSGRLYSYSLSFPPDALSKDTDITITADDASLLRVDLSPNGTSFNRPVTFQIRTGNDVRFARPIKEETLDIYWSHDDKWVPQHATLVRHGQPVTATVDLSHFSQYALGGWLGDGTGTTDPPSTTTKGKK